MLKTSVESLLQNFLEEDDLLRNYYYTTSLPRHLVRCTLKFKQEKMLLAGLPLFLQVFETLSGGKLPELTNVLAPLEGTWVGRASALTEISFDLPFHVAITGERLALNLLQRATSIATLTAQYVALAAPHRIQILDTRKTTPGLRFLEKYAVRIGGGANHRFGQVDAFMVKDNHKKILGGVRGAYQFFCDLKQMYAPIIVEIHSLKELEEAKAIGITHLMLDNFSPAEIRLAVEMKVAKRMTYEVSGGVTLLNLGDYLIPGVDAISVGALTYQVPMVDLSLKMAEIV